MFKYEPPKCEECEYWRRDTRPGKQTKGECKVDGPQMGPNGYGYWPVTNEIDFCYCGEPIQEELLLEKPVKPKSRMLNG